MDKKKLAISIIIPFIAAAIGSIFTSQTVSNWYLTLQKPSFNPPSWIFSPVWTTLYLLMGISLYLVWAKKTKTKKTTAYWAFGIQLGLNALWSMMFFGLKSPTLAFANIIALLAAMIVTTIKFYKISKTSAYLFIPYILWVSFATILNLAIVILN